MRYVYQQLPKPANIKGVEVTINVVDANGNYRTIGTTTSDGNGYYTLAWKPDISGQYTVIATFAGTNAYYGASAQTAFFADELPTATPNQTTAPLSTSDQYFLPAVAAIIASIAIATFAGTNAYYGSSAQTAFFADELPAATPTQTTAPILASEQYFLPAVVAIIVSIAIVGIVLGLLLVRKRPWIPQLNLSFFFWSIQYALNASARVIKQIL